MIINWISTISQIIVILDIELRYVEYLLIFTHIKTRESVGYKVVFTFDIFKFWPNSSSIGRQRITRSVLIYLFILRLYFK